MSNNENMFLIGEIVNTHGVKGEVRVRQITDFDERFDKGNTVYVKDKSGKYTELTIENSRFHKYFRLLKFKQFPSLEEAESLKGYTLYIKESQQTELEPGEYYYHEIIGCTVVTNEGETIGIVDHILAPGANDVWVVKDEKGKEYLIPYIPDVVKKVDVEEEIIIIEVMEGLLD
ncbi:MAG TPA: ribosome maturation factor RimM [Pseudogracilibacillus sp.]|nr:ribosome maturation factor RimM [Pseudogracilibacillus sp.]